MCGKDPEFNGNSVWKDMWVNQFTCLLILLICPVSTSYLIAAIVQSVISCLGGAGECSMPWLCAAVEWILQMQGVVPGQPCLSKSSADLITKLQSECINYALRPMLWKSPSSPGN